MNAPDRPRRGVHAPVRHDSAVGHVTGRAAYLDDMPLPPGSLHAALVLSMTAETVPSELIGSGIGYNAVAWSIGGAAGPPIFGLILDHSEMNYGLAWIVIGAVMFAGAMVMWRNFRENK